MSEYEKYDDALKAYKKELEEITQKIKNVEEEIKLMRLDSMKLETEPDLDDDLLDKLGIETETDLDDALLNKLGIETDTDLNIIEQTKTETESNCIGNKTHKSQDEIENDFVIEIGKLKLKITEMVEILNVERDKHKMKEEILGNQIDDSPIKKIINEIGKLGIELSEKRQKFEEYKLSQNKCIDECADKLKNGYEQLRLLQVSEKKLIDKIYILNNVISDTLVDDYRKYAENNGIEIKNSNELFAICNKFHQEKILKDYVFHVKCDKNELCEWRRYGNGRFCKCGSKQFYWCNKLKKPSEIGDFNIHSTTPYGDVLTLDEINRNRREFVQCGKYEKYPVWNL